MRSLRTCVRPPPVRLFVYLLTTGLLSPLANAAPPKPWEGADRPTPYTIVNTLSGSAGTVLPITGWKGRGLDMALAYYHTDDPAEGSHAWQHTFDVHLTPILDANGWTLVEANGLAKEFTYNSGSQTWAEETGYFDKLYASTEVEYADYEMTVERRNGTRLIFAHMGPGPERPGGGNSIDSEGQDERPTLVLRKIVDRNNNTIALDYYADENYEDNGPLCNVWASGGGHLMFGYTTGQTTIVSPTGEHWYVNWDGYLRITSVVNTPATTSPATSPSSREFSFAYDSNGNIEHIRDWKTNTEHGSETGLFTYVYTYADGKLSRVDSGVGTLNNGPWFADSVRPATTYAYSGSPQTTTIRRKTGQTGSNEKFSAVTHLYTAAGEVGTITRWLGTAASEDEENPDPKTVIGYTSQHLPNEITRLAGYPASGQYTTVAYSADGDVESVEPNGDGNAYLYVYNDPSNPHLPTLVRDMWGYGTIYKYDANGNLTDVWDANHTPFSVDDDDPDVTRLHTHYKVDSHGQVFAASNAAIRAYATNNQDTDSDPMPKQWRYHYDSAGNLDKVWRPNGTPSGTWYSTTTPDQTFHYTTNLSLRDWAKRYAADPQINYHYDGYARLIGIDTNNISGDEITYGYDANHMLTGMDDPTGETSWTRDALSRMTAESKDGGSLQWAYRADGQLEYFTNRDNVTMAFTYTTGGALLHEASGPWGTGNVVGFLHRECAQCGSVDGVDYPGNPGMAWRDQPDGYGGSHGGIYYVRKTNGEYAPDTDDQVYWQKIHTLTPASIGQDPSALKMIQSSGPDGLSRVEMFTQPADPLHRITDDEVSYVTYFDPEDAETQTLGDPLSIQSYTYDDEGSPGNRATVTSGEDTLAEYTYDAEGRGRLTEVNYLGGDDEEYDYGDNAGNLTEIIRWCSEWCDTVFVHDKLSKLTQIWDDWGSAFAFAGYAYDGLGRLAQAKDSYGNVTGRFYYSGDHLVYQTVVASSSAVSYQWAGGRLLSQRQTVASTPTTYWCLLDFRGNVTALVNSANNLIENYVYDAFGNELDGTFENSTAVPILNPLRYRGGIGYMKVFQACEGYSLYNAGARTYHTGIGRWLQEDPILGITSAPLSFNRYLYSNADPVLNSDPSGLTPYEYNLDPQCNGAPRSIQPCNPKEVPLWFEIALLVSGGALGGAAGGGIAGAVGAGDAAAGAITGATGAAGAIPALPEIAGPIYCWLVNSNASTGRDIQAVIDAGGTYSGYGTP